MGKLTQPGENSKPFLILTSSACQQENNKPHPSFSSNSSLVMLFQRLVLLRMSDRVPFATVLWAGTVMLCSPSGVAFRSLM